MLNNLVFELPKQPSYSSGRPNNFVVIAALLTAAYMLFAMVLVGVPQLSRGGALFSVLSFAWLALGVVAGKLVFPKVLLLPMAYYIMMLMSGFVLTSFSIDFAGRSTTIWIGAISIAAFVANGVSVKLVIAGLFVVFLVNAAAIATGYDAYLVNVMGYSQSNLEVEGVKRVSGIAGQPNLLISLVYTMPFLLFLLRRKLPLLVYVGCVAGCLLMMYLTASRSTIPLAAIFITFGALFLVKSVTLRVVFIVGGLVAAGGLYTALQDPYIISKIENSRLGEYYIVERTITGLDQEEGSSQTIRTELATNFWDSYRQRPILGYGPDQFQEVAGDGLYAHNNFAEIAVDFGTLGLLLYYGMYLFVLWGIIKYLPINYYLFAPLLYLAVSDFVFVTFTERAMVLCLCLLLLCSHNVMSQNKLRSRRARKTSYPGYSDYSDSSQSSRSSGRRRRRRRH